MKKRIRLLSLSISLAASLGILAFNAHPAQAQLDTRPLPREREVKDFSQGQYMAPQTTRFKRRPDYRELKAQREKEAREKAERLKAARAQQAIAAKNQRAQQLAEYKKRQQQAIDANNKAVSFGQQGKWAEAIAAHKEAVKLDPKNKQFKVNLSAGLTAYGQELMKAGQVDAACSLFRQAVAAAADNGMAGKMLAEAMTRQGHDPGSVDTRLAIGDQLAAAGDLQGASVEFKTAMQLEGSARTYVKMGDMALRYGQITTASNWYQQAIVKDTNYAPAHRQLGLILLNKKDSTGAAAELRKAVILDPKDVAAGQALVNIWRREVAKNPLLAENHLGLAGALQLTGDFVGAESEYRKLQQLDPQNASLAAGRQSLQRAIQHAKADKHKLAAETLYSQGLVREALSEIGQAVMLEPRNSRYQFLLGECLEASGDFRAAHQAYLTCVLIDPEKNKEAAFRMKKMQSGGSTAIRRPPVRQAAQPMAPPVASREISNNYMLPAKKMYEGGPAVRNAPQNASKNIPFRTHDESDPADGSPCLAFSTEGRNSGRQAEETTDSEPAKNDAAASQALVQVKLAEAQKNYAGAASLLRQMLKDNLQSPEIHHRLAVNLLSSGHITEAIAEFRIASALAPTNKAFSDDLARALVIHKRSLVSNGAEMGRLQ